MRPSSYRQTSICACPAENSAPSKPETLTARLAWISGRLVFDRVPLHRVVEALQRQTSSRIVIRGRFSDLLVSGTFPTTNVDESLTAIAGMIEGNVAQITPGDRYLLNSSAVYRNSKPQHPQT